MLPGPVSDDQGSPFYGRGANSAPARRQGCTQTSTSTPPPSVFTGLQNRQLSPAPSHLTAGQDPRLALSTLP